MKRSYLLLVLALGCVMAGRGWTAGAEATTQPSALAAIEPYLGEWHITATWTNGQPLDARATYEWGLNRRFIVARTFVKRPDGGEYQRYESIFAEKDGKILLFGFTYDGTTDVREVAMTGNRMDIAWQAPGGMPLRQSCRLPDADHMEWKVDAQGSDGTWQPLMDGTWVRAKAKD